MVFFLLLIACVVWWFWLAHDTALPAVTNSATIRVEHGIYDPNIITAMRGKPVVLTFIRLDEAPCAEFVVFDKLDIHQQLPLKKPTVITIEAAQPGRYDFTCQMAMYKGQLIIQ